MPTTVSYKYMHLQQQTISIQTSITTTSVIFTFLLASSIQKLTNTTIPIMFLVVVFVVLISGSATSAQLSPNFYANSCPSALAIIRNRVVNAIFQEARMAASLLRLHSQDCFVNGCDASVLLDDSTNFVGEKTATQNNNSLRGFDVVDNIKTQLERACPSVVSCADILAVAARDSVVLLGGPSWNVLLGRRDSRTASFTAANGNLPGPNFSLTQLIAAFAGFGLTPRDLVALSGAHTIGQARCTTFRGHIYNDANIDPTFAALMRAVCPASGGDDNLSPLDSITPTVFDNSYFRNLVGRRVVLHSDQELFNGGSTDSIVSTYASSQATFFSDFANAMIKMGNLSPLTGLNGEIRTNCRSVN